MITVFTPSYNRGYSLERLFISLQDQTYREFEWVVVDDGSADDTPALCDGFKERATFPMHYMRQDSAGKHIAINRGAGAARGEWFFIVDSDDWLPADSLEISYAYLSQIARDPTFAGVSGLCAHDDGSLVCTPYAHVDDCPSRVRERLALEYVDATSQEYRRNYAMPGDRAEIVRTELVRKYPFPRFEGERYVSEYYLWQSMSDRGLKLRWFNRVTYWCEYLDDGLTKNMTGVMLGSPLGRSFVDNFTLGSHAPIKMKLKSAVNYTRYGRFGGESVPELMSNAKNKMLFLAGLPVALALPLERGR